MVWMVTSGVLLILSLVLVGVGLFWDRPGWRGRPARRCCKCRYDLCDAGDVPVTCTECGRVHERERSLRRVRRHKRIVVLGVLLFVGAGVFASMPAGLRGDLMKPLPNWLLVELQPLFPEQQWGWKNHPSRELTNRLRGMGSPLTHEEVVSIIDGLADGSVFAAAGTERWERTSGRWFGIQGLQFGSKEYGWKYPDGTPGDDALIQAFENLMQVLPSWNPTTRRVWPVGSEITIHTGYTRPGWPVEGDLNERAILQIKGHEDIVVDGFRSSFDIGPIGVPGDRIEAELELSYFRKELWDRDPELEPAKTEHFRISWLVCSGVDEVLTMVDSPEIRDAMIEMVVPSIGMVLDDPGYQEGWLRFEFDRITFAIEAEVFDGDESLGTSQHRWMAIDGKWVVRTTTTGGIGMDQYTAIGTRLKQARDNGTLRVAIRAVPLQALRVPEAESVWNGEVDVLYSDAVEAAEQWAGDSAQEEAPPESTGP